jgi:hypothetical protein
MRHDSIDDATARAAPIGLDALNASASLQDRVDRKYVTTAAVAVDLLRRLLADHAVSVLTIEGARSFDYRSNYFDTDDRLLLRLAAGARRRRFKVRTRVYEAPRSCVLEVKLREDRGVTAKLRAVYEPDDALRLTDAARQFVADATAHLPTLHNLALAPSVATQYRRSTLLIGGKHPSRLTVDRRLMWASLRDPSSLRWVPVLDDVIIESKSSGTPTDADRLLWATGTRPQRVSKFGLASVLDDPRLPSNRWHRILRDAYRAGPQSADDDALARAGAIALTEAEPW